jgi:hypothetical protein
MIHICILTMLSYGAISCYSPCWLPFATFPYQFLPFLKSLLLTWNPSFCVVRSRPPWSQVGPKLSSLSPFPPHSKFPSPQGTPSLIVRPTKTTSRSRLYIVRNNKILSSTVSSTKQFCYLPTSACHIIPHSSRRNVCFRNPQNI